MNNPTLSFDFKILEVRATEDAPQTLFMSGLNKPPVESAHLMAIGGTPWIHWNNGHRTRIHGPHSAQGYAVSVFYDCQTARYLFSPHDCLSFDVINDEHQFHNEKFGWRQLSFNHVNQQHSVLALRGEHLHLSARPGAHLSSLIPNCYSCHVNSPTTCGLSGNLGLLIALTAFTAAPALSEHVMAKLDIAHRRWHNLEQQGPWGNGRKRSEDPRRNGRG